MGPVSSEVEIDTPRERAFEYVADLANRPAFTDDFIGDFHLLGVDSTGIGAGARFRSLVPPRATWMDMAISRLEPPHRISERGHGGRENRTAVATEWEFLEGPAALTTVRVIFSTEPPPGIGRLLERFGAASHWQERAWSAALRRLRDLLESERPPPVGAGVAGGNRVATGVP
jgi:uncharacterized protein YndB with AHSA1/START domain